MAPTPLPLDQEVTLSESRFGSIEDAAIFSENPINEAGGYSLEQQENIGRLAHDHKLNQSENTRPLHPDNSQPRVPMVNAPKRSASWFVRKEQKDPNGHNGKSMSPSNTNYGEKLDPPETRQTTPCVGGIMMREDDFLDRTFDNVENVTCHRTSISKAPPAPIFSCNTPGNGNALRMVDEIDLAVLSLAKQQGYNIEQYHRNDIEDDEGQPSPPLSEHPPLIPVNSIIEGQQSGGHKASQMTISESAVVVPKRDMLDFFFENVHSMVCREDRSLAIGAEDTKKIEIEPQEIEKQQQPAASICVDGNSSGESSPLNLHQTVLDQKSDGPGKGCDGIFTSVSKAASDVSETCSRNPSYRREPFAPIRFEEQIPSTNGPKLRTGMMLLADGSIVVPGEHSNEWIDRQRRRSLQSANGGMSSVSSSRPPFQNSPSIQAIRESSLLDKMSRSGDASDGNAQRVKHQKRARTDGKNQTFFIPDQSDDEECARGVRALSKEKSSLSAEDIERKNFWKQIILASVILLVACGLIVFAMSFFWPAHKMT
ncbi:hypothetical protein IV203_031877 [Nitzschia inconspicua]|uniref:Uncharacterized protein n=1 Tax=Nitzschia inconspicua TaxID=303405 RepID=A0A9K3Q5I8_9STRA|nr:hypothetical protein IV203_031877 [Nitzschia inconspicua]